MCISRGVSVEQAGAAGNVCAEIRGDSEYSSLSAKSAFGWGSAYAALKRACWGSRA